jgi:hypothetical protein
MKSVKLYLLILLLLLFPFFNTAAKSPIIKLGSHSTDSRIKARNITIELGDSTKSKFEPDIIFSAWEGECKFKIRLQNDNFPNKNTSFDETISLPGISKYSLNISKMKHEFYKKIDGNFEWEITLDKKPQSNKLVFDIEISGLSFYYQPPLTIEESVSGHFRPDSVVGSYAVYHATRKNDYYNSDGSSLNYGTGKAFHIYRPKAWDITGDTIWLEMNIDTVKNNLTIIIDSSWLESANFPITIDPTIGRTDMGASDFTWASSLSHNKYIMYDSSKHTSSSNGTLQTAYIAVKTTAGTKTDSLSLAIYDWSTTLSNCDLIDSVAWEIVHSNTTYNWFSNSGLSANLIADSSYIVGVSGKGESANNLRYAYDLGAWASTKYISGSDFSWPATMNGFSNTSGYFISAYASYTTGVASSVISGRRRKIINNN